MEVSAVLVATDGWRSTFPGAVVGALVMRGIHNPEHNVALEAAKRRLEQDLQAGADGPDADRIPRAYRDYYRARGSTYHVKAQRESVARKGRPIPRRRRWSRRCSWPNSRT
jgi:hypothetical protein